MAWTYEDVIPPIIANTVMIKAYQDGIHRTYRITAESGYVLHDKNYDEAILDEYMQETGEIKLGYRRSQASCPANYDFEANPREFYTVPENEVPPDQIYGGGNTPEVETM